MIRTKEDGSDLEFCGFLHSKASEEYGMRELGDKFDVTSLHGVAGMLHD